MTDKTSFSEEQRLDFNILYLRRVNGLCYYCMDEHDDERMLSSRCGNAHVRALLNTNEAQREVYF